MSSWTLPSTPPHDWFLCLDIEQYFDHEHDPETVFEDGFTRPIPAGDRDIIVTAFFNGDVENPEFHCQSPESLSKQEIELANKSLARIFGTRLDLRPLYDRIEDDPVLSPKLTDLYGLKRMARANLFEDAVNRIIEMRLSHKPTAKRMVHDVREKYGTTLVHNGKNIPAWPRPHQLVKADPMSIRKLGPTKRKGEFIIGMAEDILSGEIDLDYLEECDPRQFYETIKEVRGIGPTSAQQLMLFRNRTDAAFPSNKKSGEEKGLRKWIILSYGGDPDSVTEEEFQQMIAHWQGYEAAALEFMFADWVLSEKEKQQKS
ncbi:DNA-3-methyladenine glycosylase family protein [Halalkalibaculum sp. DA384]|uniref:DNA-3-methyladenine glycosylase family protein n=1 Tax=Halalkalibaculum sp. DA384 TaxID=3373606 RepID=UPI0037554055